MRLTWTFHYYLSITTRLTWPSWLHQHSTTYILSVHHSVEVINMILGQCATQDLLINTRLLCSTANWAAEISCYQSTINQIIERRDVKQPRFFCYRTQSPTLHSLSIYPVRPTVRPNYVGIKVNLSSIIFKLQTQIYLINFWVILLKPHDKKYWTKTNNNE